MYTHIPEAKSRSGLDLDAIPAATEVHVMARLDAGFERLLNEMTSLKADFQNSKGFLLAAGGRHHAGPAQFVD